MANVANRRAVFLALVLSLAASALHAQGVPAAGGVDRPDDAVFLGRLIQNATALCAQGLTRNLKELKTELDRTGVTATLEPCVASRVELPTPELYTLRCRSVLTVVRLYKCNKCQNWHMGNEATAFALNSQGLLATCRHVFELPDDGPMIVADQDGNVFPIRAVLASHAGDDVAIVQIDLAAAVPANTPAPEPVPLRTGAPVGTAINIVGHPGNQHYVLTRGIISRRTSKPGGINGRNHGPAAQTSSTVLNVTAEFAVGSSGAPVLDDAGNAVAMVVSTTTIRADGKRDGDPQMVIRNCIGAEQIERLLHPGGTSAVGTAPAAHP